MTSLAKMSTGIMLAYNGTVYAELLDVTAPPFSVEKVDATSHDSAYKTTVPGEPSYGDLTWKCNFLNDTSQAALRVLARAKTVGTWEVVYPANFGNLSYSVPGFVSSMKKTTPMKGSVATMDVSITPTGDVNENAVAASPLTTPWVTITDNTPTSIVLTPTAADAVRTYAGTALQAAIHLHVTPTAAAGTIYVDGIIVATGQPSGAIAYALADFPTGSVKTIFVMVKGTAAGQAAAIYRLDITRGVA